MLFCNYPNISLLYIRDLLLISFFFDSAKRNNKKKKKIQKNKINNNEKSGHDTKRSLLFRFWRDVTVSVNSITCSREKQNCEMTDDREKKRKSQFL